MAKRTINVKEITQDLKAGMNDAALMEKYRLTEKSLQSLFKKRTDSGVLKNSALDEQRISLQQKTRDPANHKEYLEPMEALAAASQKAHHKSPLKTTKREMSYAGHARLRKIKAKEIVADIRARLSDFEIMSKYGLSLEQLEKVLEGLLKAGEIRGAEIKERGPFFDDPANRPQTRRFPRIYLRVPLEIEDLNDSANKGLLIDLSEDGIRTRGIAAVVGEEKFFLVSLKEVRQRTVRLWATCIWAKQDVDAKVLQEAGFKIVHISESDLLEIRRVAGLLGLGDRNLSRKR